jgi:hypothetical protein
MKLILSLILATLIAFPANAATAPRQAFSKYGTVITTTALSASSTSFTVNLDNAAVNGTYGLAIVWVSIVDASNSVTAINMICTSSPNGGVTDYTLQDCASVVDGVCTSANASWTKNPAAITSPKRWPWRIDIEGLPELECTFTDTGGDGSDTISVDLTFATKG